MAFAVCAEKCGWEGEIERERAKDTSEMSTVSDNEY